MRLPPRGHSCVADPRLLPADSRGANCCLELRTILDCDPVGPCLGFAGDCADLQTQFAGVQGPWLYSDDVSSPPTEHDSIDGWVCHAFPDDAYVTDQFFVGLISVAVALPVDLVLQRAFEIANESEMPGNWLDAPPGKWKLLLGKDAHNGWRLADPRRPVSEFVRWMVGGGAESDLQAVLFIVGYALRRLRARLCGEPEAPEEDEAAKSKAGSDAASVSSSGSAAARSDALVKRLYAAAGLLGVYVTWAIMSWCVALRSLELPPLQSPCELVSRRALCRRFIFTYGMLIYRQLGPDAQAEFAKSWGIGYGLNNASEWQDVAVTAFKAALLIVVLDALRLTKNSSWFEEHVDFVSMQALLFNGAAKGWWRQTHALVRMQARLTED